MRTKIIFSLLLMSSFVVSAQKEDEYLKLRLLEIANQFKDKGEVGIYVRNIKTNHFAAVSADTIFPTASMIKIPITIGMFDKIEKGEFDYHTVLTYKDSLLYEGEDILGSFKDNEKIALSKVLMLMITTSDNTASLWCQSLAGGGSTINDWLQKSGFKNTRVNSRTPGRETYKEKYGWGQTTPREMAELLVRIRKGLVVSSRASERIYRNLARIYFDSEALSQIPPYIHTASKQGAVDASRSEVVLVNAPHGDYVFCVITKNQKDQGWAISNAGYILIRKISHLLWHYYEPGSTWKPADKIDEWY